MKKFYFIFFLLLQGLTSRAQDSTPNSWHFGLGIAAYYATVTDTFVTRHQGGAGRSIGSSPFGSGGLSPQLGFRRQLTRRLAIDASLNFHSKKSRLNENAFASLSFTGQPAVVIDLSSPYRAWALWGEIMLKYQMTRGKGPKFSIGTGLSSSWRVHEYRSFFEVELGDQSGYAIVKERRIRRRALSYGIPVGMELDFALPGRWTVGVEAKGSAFFNGDYALGIGARIGRFF